MSATDEVIRPEDQTLQAGGQNLTRQNVLDTLQYGIDRLGKEMGVPLTEIGIQDMLFVNKHGQRCDFMDKEGGVRSIDTVQERERLAAKDPLAAKFKVTEEVAVDEAGRPVSAADFYHHMDARQQMDEMSRAFKDVEEGRVNLSQLPDTIRVRVMELEKIKQEDPMMKDFGKEIVKVLEAEPTMQRLEQATGFNLSFLTGAKSTPGPGF